MKIRNEVWVIKRDGSIVPKPKKADRGDLLVVYTECVGFHIHTSSAVIVPFGESGIQKRMGFSHEEGTTFPSMLAMVPALANLAGTTILKQLESIGYGADKYAQAANLQMLDAVQYAAVHEKELSSFEISWTRI